MAAPRTRALLVAVLLLLAAIAGMSAQLRAALGLTLHDPDGPAVDAAAWLLVGGCWIALALRDARALATLWRLPSALFRSGLGVGGGTVVAGRVVALAQTGTGPYFAMSALESTLYELGVVALASLAAFALTRSLLRPVLTGTRPPVGARDIALRTRILVATTGASFATAGILLNVLLDFGATPPSQLASYLATAGALVLSSALIGWLVGEDAARSMDHVTRRMRDLARADASMPSEVPVIAADEVGDLIVAANELERRIRREEAQAAATSERERIARELHDGVAKSVSVLALEIASLQARAPADLRRPLERTGHLARTLAEELRAIVHEFRARTEGEPFRETLRRAMRVHAGADLEVAGDVERLGGLARFEVLRILDEALRNAEHHAGATRTRASIAVDEQALHLVVEDDGRGVGAIPWADLAAQGHFGLLGMRERAELLEGALRVEARSGGGTRLSMDVPIERNGS